MEYIVIVYYYKMMLDNIYVILLLVLAVSSVMNMWAMKIPPFGPWQNLFIEPEIGCSMSECIGM